MQFNARVGRGRKRKRERSEIHSVRLITTVTEPLLSILLSIINVRTLLFYCITYFYIAFCNAFENGFTVQRHFADGRKRSVLLFARGRGHSAGASALLDATAFVAAGRPGAADGPASAAAQRYGGRVSAGVAEHGLGGGPDPGPPGVLLRVVHGTLPGTGRGRAGPPLDGPSGARRRGPRPFSAVTDGHHPPTRPGVRVATAGPVAPAMAVGSVAAATAAGAGAAKPVGAAKTTTSAPVAAAAGVSIAAATATAAVDCRWRNVDTTAGSAAARSFAVHAWHRRRRRRMRGPHGGTHNSCRTENLTTDLHVNSFTHCVLATSTFRVYKFNF